MDCSWLRCVLMVATLPLIASCGSAAGDSGGGSGDVPSDIAVTFPATDTSVSLDYDFSAAGSGGGIIGGIDINSSQGTIVIDSQTLETIIYASIPWGESGYNLYQGVAFSDTDIFIYWLYCNASSNSLDRVYYESSNQYSLTREAASGTCDPQVGASEPSFSLTQRDVGISRLVSGYNITGSDISLSSGEAGTLTYDGTSYALYPFQSVDCSGCSGGSWQELHSIAYDEAGGRACFTILYLFADTSDSVFSIYSICFPDLNNINAVLSGSWLAQDLSRGY